MKISEKQYKIVKWAIMFAAYAFLVYKLWTFDNYSQLSEQWKEASGLRAVWIVAVLLLLPVNWAIESLKWCFLLTDVERITYKTSLKSILSGITLGFFTPNRVGEFPGRALYLHKENRITAIALGFVGTLSQTLSILICGIPASIIFFTMRKNIEQVTGSSLTLFFIIAATVFLLFYFLLPQISRILLKKEIKKNNLRNILTALSQFSVKKTSGIFMLSFIRYTVFCIQFYCMLRFFGVELSAWEAVVGIASNYLFVTFTPSVAFSELAIRGSYSMIFIGAFSPNLVGVALSGACIWVVNYCIPMIIGSMFFSKTKWN